MRTLRVVALLIAGGPTWGASETRYFLKDYLGSMVAEADDQGVIQQSYSFDAP